MFPKDVETKEIYSPKLIYSLISENILILYGKRLIGKLFKQF